MRLALHILLIILPVFSHGQSAIGWLVDEAPEDSVQQLAVDQHTSVRPAIRLKEWKHERNWSLTPAADMAIRFNSDLEFKSALGIAFEAKWKEKWYVRLLGLQGIGQSDSVLEPKSYLRKNQPFGYSYSELRGRIGYTPNEVFQFQAGLDHNFIGEGNRSLFLSDYGVPSPFGQIRTRFWRVEYTVLYQFFREQLNDQWKQKNGATHHISFNATKWLNFGVFETVIFQPKDTLLNRGYEVEYLNPVIFYRPQEYALGSSDNVLLGLSMTAKWRKHTFYSQFILDEFSLTEWRANSGWWANKYGGQVGVKGRLEKNKHYWFYRLEFNAVRPYTYAHLTSGQNYGNQGSTLSHPYGGNFMELLAEFKFNYEKWHVDVFTSYSLRGKDNEGISYGGDIYQPYTLRPFEYDHKIGQGQGVNRFHIFVRMHYPIFKKTELRAFIENHLSYSTYNSRWQYTPVIGLRSFLWNDYRNY